MGHYSRVYFHFKLDENKTKGMIYENDVIDLIKQCKKHNIDFPQYILDKFNKDKKDY